MAALKYDSVSAKAEAAVKGFIIACHMCTDIYNGNFRKN